MIGMDETLRYIQTAENVGANIKTVVAEGQDHGFAQKYYMPEFVRWLEEVTNSVG